MKRKIVKQGSATMTVSLPATWIKKYGLVERDELDMFEDGNKIILSTGQAIGGKKKIELDATKLGVFTKNNLSHLYMVGYDEVLIHYEDNKILEQIKQRVPDCIGFEIINQTKNTIHIKSISSELEEEFDNILRKVFLITKDMAEEIYDALSKKDFNRLYQIRDMETLNNKFVNFLQRLLAKKGYKKQERTSQMYDMLQNLERIGDEYKYICDSYKDSNSKKEFDNDALKLLNKINIYFKTFYELFYKFDSEKREFIYKHKSDYKKEALVALASKKEIMLNHHLANLIEKIYNAVGSYLALDVDSNNEIPSSTTKE
jgi:phosphate uptake regulator